MTNDSFLPVYHSSFFSFHTHTVPFLGDLSLAKEGFSLHFKLMLDNDIESYEEARYLFDLAAKDGNNMHCYILKGHICCGIIYNGKLSQVS